MNDIDATILDRLFAVIESRKGADPSASWTAKLLAGGPEAIARKVGEESTETIVAALAQDRDALDRLATRLPDVADSNELDFGVLQEVAENASAAAPDAESGEHDTLARGGSAVLAQELAGDNGRNGQDGARLSRSLKRLSSRQSRRSSGHVAVSSG